jgi:FtsZ-binding cell division protein ZapB
MLLETAVEYIRYLQEQVEELRESCNSGHATQKVELG